MMGIIVWDKMNCLSNTAWGSWKKPSAPSLRSRQEYIIIAGKGDKFLRKEHVEPDNYTDREFLNLTAEIWSFVPESNRDLHPAPFPIELPHRLMKLYSYKQAIILDPFCGSGTTCVAAKLLGRNFIGIDISQAYVDIANNRLKNTEECLFKQKTL
jgi:site-specific DNA-methyltransferase (adenine-specific)